MAQKKIAVTLSGCGFKDGSEIREAVGTLWALSTEGAEVQCFAPHKDQADVVNTLTMETDSQDQRNCLIESARIARGDVKPLDELDPKVFDGLIMPGGFGVAKNLCTFAFEGSNGKVIPEMQKILESFHQEGKPMGAICISPALVGLAFKDQPFELTLGETSEASAELEKLGHQHIVCQPHEYHVDEKHKVVSTPAYMFDDGSLKDIFQGIHGLTQNVLKLA